LEKQFFLNRCSKTLIDSLKLEDKLGIYNHNLFQDTLLIKANSNEIKNFLRHNSKYLLKKKIPYKEIDPALRPIYAHDSINASTIYNESVKEYLSFGNLLVNIQLKGITTPLDSLAKHLRVKYPNAIELQQLNKLYKEYEALKSGKFAPDFQLTSVDEKVYSLANFNGKVILIDVWATWCGPCKTALPAIMKLRKKYKNSEIVFLFISIDRKEEKWKEYLNKNPQFKGIHVRQEANSFGKIYKVGAVPRYIIIDKEGKIVDAFAKPPKKGMESVLENLLKE
jgi:thiol-disulfide isomerase/thioredoxin